MKHYKETLSLFIFFLSLSFFPTLSLNAELSSQCKNIIEKIFKDQNDINLINQFLSLQTRITLYKIALAKKRNSYNENNLERAQLEKEQETSSTPELKQVEDNFNQFTLSPFEYARITSDIENLLLRQRENTTQSIEERFLIRDNDLKMLYILYHQEQSLDAQAPIKLSEVVDIDSEANLSMLELSLSRLYDFLEMALFSFDTTIPSPDGSYKKVKLMDICFPDLDYESLSQSCQERTLDFFSKEVLNLIEDFPTLNGFLDSVVISERPLNYKDTSIIQYYENVDSNHQDKYLDRYIRVINQRYANYFTRSYLERNPEFAFQLARAIDTDLRSPQGVPIFYMPTQNGNYQELYRPEFEPKKEITRRFNLKNKSRYSFPQTLSEYYDYLKANQEKKICGLNGNPTKLYESPDKYSGNTRSEIERRKEFHQSIAVMKNLMERYEVYNSSSSTNVEKRQALASSSGHERFPRVIFYNNQYCDTKTGFVIEDSPAGFFSMAEKDLALEVDKDHPRIPSPPPSNIHFQCILDGEIASYQRELRPSYICEGKLFSYTGEQLSPDQDDYYRAGSLPASILREKIANLDQKYQQDPLLHQAVFEERLFFERDGKLAKITYDDEGNVESILELNNLSSQEVARLQINKRQNYRGLPPDPQRIDNALNELSDRSDETQTHFLSLWTQAVERSSPTFQMNINGEIQTFFSQTGRNVDLEDACNGVDTFDCRVAKEKDTLNINTGANIEITHEYHRRNPQSSTCSYTAPDGTTYENYYSIVDKKTGTISVYYNNNGKPELIKIPDRQNPSRQVDAVFQVGLGKNVGDKRLIRNDMDSIDGNGYTGAGIYTIGRTSCHRKNLKEYNIYNYGNLAQIYYRDPMFVGANRNSIVLALHSVPQSTKAFRDARIDMDVEELGGKSRRVSGGCVNLKLEDYQYFEELFLPAQNPDACPPGKTFPRGASIDDELMPKECPLYILPEDQATKFSIVDGMIHYEAADRSLCNNPNALNGCSNDYAFSSPSLYESAQDKRFFQIDNFSISRDFVEDSGISKSTEIYCKAKAASIKKDPLVFFKIPYEDIFKSCKNYMSDLQHDRITRFMNTLKNQKEYLVKTINERHMKSLEERENAENERRPASMQHVPYITDKEYNDLARLATALVSVESDFCTSPKLDFKIGAPSFALTIVKNLTRGDRPDNDQHSRGCGQVKNSAKTIERFLGIEGFDERTLTRENPEWSAKTTMLHLLGILMDAKANPNDSMNFLDSNGQLTNYEEFMYHYYQGRDETVKEEKITPDATIKQVEIIKEAMQNIHIALDYESEIEPSWR